MLFNLDKVIELPAKDRVSKKIMKAIIYDYCNWNQWQLIQSGSLFTILWICSNQILVQNKQW